MKEEQQKRWNKSITLCCLFSVVIYLLPSTTAKIDFPQLMFDLPTIKQKFGGIEEGRNMIVHEQLSAMQKSVGLSVVYMSYLFRL